MLLHQLRQLSLLCEHAQKRANKRIEVVRSSAMVDLK
jgi:hypothetical protein